MDAQKKQQLRLSSALIFRTNIIRLVLSRRRIGGVSGTEAYCWRIEGVHAGDTPRQIILAVPTAGVFVLFYRRRNARETGSVSHSKFWPCRHNDACRAINGSNYVRASS